MNYREKDYSFIDDFANRHCGLLLSERQQMLKKIGLSKLEDIVRVMPKEIISECETVGEKITEQEALEVLYGYAEQNKIIMNMIGLGYYNTFMPAVIRRKLFEDPGWYTSYTPYQPEVAQGHLEMLLNFQTMISDLTGLPMAGASLLDESTSCAEAMMLFRRVSKSDSNIFLVDKEVFPQTLAVLQTRAKPLGIKLVLSQADTLDQQGEAFGALISYPSSDGGIKDWTNLIQSLKNKNILVALTTDLLALALIKSPGDMGADVAVGSAQRFGLPMGFGGPHPGFIAFRQQYRMRVPGRIVGISKDIKGRKGYRLSLQSREQHIRREKATSNICTSQALPAMLSAAYAIYHGPKRIIAIASRVQELTELLVAGLEKLGFSCSQKHYFGTIKIFTNAAKNIAERAVNYGINLYCDDKSIGISLDEEIRLVHIKKIWKSFNANKKIIAQDLSTKKAIPKKLLRTKDILTNKVFNSYHTEQEMMRYLRMLSEKDIALNRSMIPLGSCTMKLNATVEMLPISWRHFTNIHPFAPINQVTGYLKLLNDFSDILLKLTGFSGVSLQPNSGAQGEYAGLLAIKSYLEYIGQNKRDICLIPKSAHGTNPASATMAGMKVIVVDIDSYGQVDVDDLQVKITEYKDSIAALMITYPSTCGVFGTSLKKICTMVHNVGGQVYMDGANFNALVGLSKPGLLGPDVMHINLHKTFSVPHGGGGPGVGPIVVAKHLIPFLPGHPLVQSSPKNCGTITSAPYGSALLIVISWIYIRMMGNKGLKQATLTALLNANYIAKRLQENYPLMYSDKNGYVAHECIIDTRQFKKTAGISVEDIAKRLMDYGFHAPTISWPITGAMMIEPTESESQEEIDRFCDALLNIRKEISQIEQGELPKDDNPLVNAPHTAQDLLADNWHRAYSRATAAYPLDWLYSNKYWPPIARIDSAYGDRNLVCTCPDISNYK